MSLPAKQQTEAEVWQSSTQSKLPIFRRSIVLVGPPRVGKTCVRKALAKEAFNPAEESTDGVESCALDTSTWVVRGATSVGGFSRHEQAVARQAAKMVHGSNGEQGEVMEVLQNAVEQAQQEQKQAAEKRQRAEEHRKKEAEAEQMRAEEHRKKEAEAERQQRKEAKAAGWIELRECEICVGGFSYAEFVDYYSSTGRDADLLIFGRDADYHWDAAQVLPPSEWRQPDAAQQRAKQEQRRKEEEKHLAQMVPWCLAHPDRAAQAKHAVQQLRECSAEKFQSKCKPACQGGTNCRDMLGCRYAHAWCGGHPVPSTVEFVLCTFGSRCTKGNKCNFSHDAQVLSNEQRADWCNQAEEWLDRYTQQQQLDPRATNNDEAGISIDHHGVEMSQWCLTNAAGAVQAKERIKHLATLGIKKFQAACQHKCSNGTSCSAALSCANARPWCKGHPVPCTAQFVRCKFGNRCNRKKTCKFSHTANESAKVALAQRGDWCKQTEQWLDRYMAHGAENVSRGAGADSTQHAHSIAEVIDQRKSV